MHQRIVFNERLLDADAAPAGLAGPATLHGHGVFTAIPLYDRHPFLWPEHFARLAEHARRVGLDASEHDEARVSDSLIRLVEANEVREGVARVVLLARGGFPAPHDCADRGDAPSDLLIFTEGKKEPFADGMALTVSPHRVNTLSPLAGVKSTSYLEHVLARREARSREFDEAVRLNERGEVTSATAANVFWVTDGTLHTPELQTGAVAGVTRARVLTLAGEMAFPTVEGVYELSALAEADEIFLTSASLGVEVVTTFDFRRYAIAVGSVALRLREAFRQLTLAPAAPQTQADAPNPA